MSRRKEYGWPVFDYWPVVVHLLFHLIVFGLICWGVYQLIVFIGPPARQPDPTEDEIEQFCAARRVMAHEARRYLLMGLVALMGVAAAALYAAYCFRAPIAWCSEKPEEKERSTTASKRTRAAREDERYNTISIDPETLEDSAE